MQLFSVNRDTFEVVIGEFPNLSQDKLPPFLADCPGWQYLAIFAEDLLDGLSILQWPTGSLLILIVYV